MARNAVFDWLDGRGWLVLAGGTPASEAVRAHALGIAAADGAVAYVATQGVGVAAEQMLRDMEDLGARSGYLVDLLAEDDNIIRDKLADAGMIMIGADDSAGNVRSALLGAAAEGIQQAYENGAVVLAEGASATVFGAWVVLDDGRITSGMEWLHAVLIVPGSASGVEVPATKMVMAAQPTAIVLGVGGTSALAFGPDGEVEPWGDQEVSIALGPGFGA